MENIAQFIQSLGGLHDTKVEELLWATVERRFELQIDNVYSNFDGLPGYQGPEKGRFIFSQVSKLYSYDIDLAEVGLMIYSWTFQQAEVANYRCEILFSPGGKMFIECRDIEYKKNSA